MNRERVGNVGWCERLVRLVLNERNDHTVEVEEEQDKVEAELDKGFLAAVSHVQAPFVRAMDLPSYGCSIS